MSKRYFVRRGSTAWTEITKEIYDLISNRDNVQWCACEDRPATLPAYYTPLPKEKEQPDGKQR